MKTIAVLLCLLTLAAGRALAFDPADDSLNFYRLAVCAIPGYISDVAVQGDVACVAASDSGLVVVNVANPAAPVVIGRLATPPKATGVAIRGDYAYVTCHSAGLRVVSIADPANPVQVGYHDTPYWALHVVVVETLAYIGDFVAGLRIINVADPTNPREIGFVLANRGANGVAVAGGHACIADADRLSVVNISDPTEPVLVGSCTTNYARAVAVVDTFAYVADSQEGMRVVSIADPAQPRILASWPATFAASVQATAGRVYLSTTERFVTFDPARPGNPQPDGYYDMVAVASATAGDICYVSAGSEGLWVLRHGDAAVAEPRPREALPAGRRAVIVRAILDLDATAGPARLFDATGRLVLELTPGRNDLSGLAPGVYQAVTADRLQPLRVVRSR